MISFTSTPGHAAPPAPQSGPPVPDVPLPDLPPGLSPEDVMHEDDKSNGAPIVPWGLQVQLWGQAFLNELEPGTLLVSGVARSALDFRHEWNFGREWRISLSDRLDAALDVVHDGRLPPDQGAWNSLRELWIGWQRALDGGVVAWTAGRMNVRNGVASGYNPSDFFKVDAVRTSLSLDPSALRVNRLGAAMLQLQYLDKGGALTVDLVPRLAKSPPPALEPVDTDPWYALGFERTNSAASVLVTWAPQISDRLSGDALLYVRQGQGVRAAANVSGVLGPAWVANAEAVVGHCRPLPAPGAASGESICPWAAVNVTWTTPIGLELTLEYQYAGDALSADAWSAWRTANLSPALGAQLQVIETARTLAREPLVQSGWFLRGAWRDPLDVRGLALSAFVQMNGFDGSCLTQLAADWMLHDDWSVGGNVIGYLGGFDTEFGQSLQRVALGLYLAKAF